MGKVYIVICESNIDYPTEGIITIFYNEDDAKKLVDSLTKEAEANKLMMSMGCNYYYYSEEVYSSINDYLMVKGDNQ